MTLGFDAGPREAACRFCGRAVHPELLTDLEVPYLRQPAFAVCPDCRDDYLRGGWTPRAYVPALELPAHLLWPEPSAADLEAADGELRAALAAYLDARARLARLAREEPQVSASLRAAPPERPLRQLWLRDEALARLAFGLDPELEGLLEAAWEALDECLPNYGFTTAAHAQAAVWLARLTLELGERAPRSYGPRKAGPAAWLKELSDQARLQPALRDPRVPLLRALLFREEDHLHAVDAELTQAEVWLAALDDDGRWQDARFTAAYARHLRARDARRWLEARQHLQTCCALRPDESQLFVRLAHAYLTTAQPHVAREVLAAKLPTSKVTPAAVDDLIAASLNELRPRLETWRRGREDDVLRVLYGACLLGLGEHDEAWRALDGDGLLADAEAPDPAQAARLHLAGLVAHRREAFADAARLLEAARGAGADAQHDLLGVIADAAREQLEALEAQTRDRDADEAWGADLAETLLGGPDPDPLAPPSLERLQAWLRQHRAILLAATSDHERTVFAQFLGRELADGFHPLVAPPSLADRDDVRVADPRLRIDLVYRDLARRRLPEAFRQDQAAREVAGHATPFHLLLTWLELVRRGGPRVHAWASRAWASLPIRRPPLGTGLLVVSAEALNERDVTWLAALLDDPTRPSTAGQPSLRELRGRCRLIFPGDAPPHAQARDPAVRAFVRALFAACPAFPFVLDLGPERGQLELFFGCLASPDALLDAPPHLALLDASLRDPLRAALMALEALAATLGLDRAEVGEPLLRRLPPERRAELTG